MVVEAKRTAVSANGEKPLNNRDTDSLEIEFLPSSLRRVWLMVLLLQIHCFHRQIPVRVENFEPALFLALVGLLVGKELLL